jgi:hypothetical protein
MDDRTPAVRQETSMIKRCVVCAVVALSLAMAGEAMAQPKTNGIVKAKPRFYNPFVPRYRRLTITTFGFPAFQTTATGTTVVASSPTLSTPVVPSPVATPSPVVTPAPVAAVAAAAPATAAAELSQADDDITPSVVTRPNYRPPVRSPYRPPPRPPF